MVWYRDRQWYRIKDPEIKSCPYTHLIFDNEAKIFNEKKKASSISGNGLTGVRMQKNENRPVFFTLHKAQIQMDQGPQHKTRYTESNR